VPADLGGLDRIQYRSYAELEDGVTKLLVQEFGVPSEEERRVDPVSDPGRFAFVGEEAPIAVKTSTWTNASLMNTVSAELRIQSSTPGVSSWLSPIKRGHTDGNGPRTSVETHGLQAFLMPPAPNKPVPWSRKPAWAT
jgi:hypothetical protein